MSLFEAVFFFEHYNALFSVLCIAKNHKSHGKNYLY